MEKPNLGYKASFVHQNSTVKMQLSLVAFDDDDDSIHYVYCPALNITGYGHTNIEAKSSFEKTLELYMNYTINKGTFADDLKAHGWNLSKKKFTSPPFSDMLKYQASILKHTQTSPTTSLSTADCCGFLEYTYFSIS